MASPKTIALASAFVGKVAEFLVLKKCPPGSQERLLFSSAVFLAYASSAYHLLQDGLSHVFPEFFLVFFVGPMATFSAFSRLFITKTWLDEKSTKDIPLWRQALYVDSPRRIGHPDQAKNIPGWGRNKKAEDVGRTEMVVFRVSRCVLFFAVLALGSRAESDPIEHWPLTYLDLWRNDWTIADIFPAYLITFVHWFSGYMMLTLLYDFISVVFVGSGLYEAKDWPPLFASVTTLCSVRGFWSVFWHQFLRRTLETNSEFLVHTVLRFPRYRPSSPTGPLSGCMRLMTRYLKIFSAFAISGLIHIYCDLLLGLAYSDTWAFSYFISQAVGVVIEDVAQAIYRRLMGSHRMPKLEKIVGFIWAATFLSITTPTWAIPITNRTMGLPLLPPSLDIFKGWV